MTSTKLKLLTVKDANHWRRWLATNYQKVNEIWLVFYKKETGKVTINYNEAVEEAVCFGWIDGLKRKIDEERYTYRFTPRKPKSKWSRLNIKRAKKMIGSGKMTEFGLRVFEAREEYDEAFNAMRAQQAPSLSNTTEKVLKQNPLAWKNFNDMAPGYRKRYIIWIESAKKAETREKRLAQAVKSLEANEKPY